MVQKNHLAVGSTEIRKVSSEISQQPVNQGIQTSIKEERMQTRAVKFGRQNKSDVLIVLLLLINVCYTSQTKHGGPIP